MQTQIDFEIPEKLAGRLATGEYERVGGVIRQASGRKEVVAWLRETSMSPKSPSGLSAANPLLSMVGSVASVLNLGATVAFGAATLRKLGHIEAKADEINHKSDIVIEKIDVVDSKLGVINAKLNEINYKSDVVIAKLDELEQRSKNLQWTVDLGFVYAMQSLQNIKEYQEVQLAGELNSAANMAWSCQFLEPNSPQRLTRIENAFNTISIVTEKLLLHTENEMKNAIGWMQNKRSDSDDFNIDDSIITSLYRLRQTIVACALSASISAEADDLYTAGKKLAKEQERLSALLSKLVSVSLNSEARVYQTLLSEPFRNIMPAMRLDDLIARFDPEFNGLSDIVELLRIEGFEPKDDLEELMAEANSMIGDIEAEDSIFVDGNQRKKVFKAVFMEGDKQAILASMLDATYSASEDNEGDMVKRVAEMTGLIFMFKIAYIYQRSDRQAMKIEANINANTSLFFDLIDGLYEDLQRLQGYEAEYNAAVNLGVSICEYRDLLRIDEIPENKHLVFFTIKEEGLLAPVKI